MLRSSRLPVLRLLLPVTVAGLALGGCDYFTDDGPLRVVAIGTNTKMTNPDHGRPNLVSQSLLSATAQGLVSFDGDGQIEPGLAERWIVTDDGLSYIFRIRAAKWSNGDKVTTAHVAALLRAHINAASKNRYAAEISGVQTIKPMTAQVVEIRLARPLPHLLDILAQPDMALLRGGKGWGPMTASLEDGALFLTAKKDAAADGEVEILSEDIAPVKFLARPAAKALARYQNKQADVILGGRFEDYPLVRAAAIDTNRIIVDPAEGLFGLVFTHSDGILGNDDVRRAISMAIRRPAITQSFGETSWTPLLSIRPPLDKQDPAYAPVLPEYADWSEEDRVQRASETIANATERLARKPVLRIALPNGVGADLLFANLKADLRAVGLEALQVKLQSAADLRLIDEVAPSRDPFWYIRRLSCGRGYLCNSAVDARLAKAEAAAEMTERATALREAETMLVETASYIPLAEPLRWSVTSPRSPNLKPNPRARHPLNRLAAIPN